MDDMLTADAQPPGPRLPPLLQSASWIYRPIEVLRECRCRYGETFTLRFAGFPPLVVLTDPAAVREVFTGDPELLYAGRTNLILRPILGARSLLLLDGKRHPGYRPRMKRRGVTFALAEGLPALRSR